MPWVKMVLAMALAVAATAAVAQEDAVSLGNEEIYSESLAALTMLFVLAVLLESAFALIFNWRVFKAYFSTTGVRTIIMFVGALAVVNLFGIDIVASLVAAYTNSEGDAVAVVQSGTASVLVTAMILAGGSGGVHNIMKTLGYRTNAADEAEPVPPRDKAWVSVRVQRKTAVGEVTVHLREGALADTNSPAPIAGTVGGRLPRLRGLLLRDANRFPQNGGYQVKADTLYHLTVEGKDRRQNRIAPIDNVPYVFAGGAIVDLEVTA